MDRVLLKNKARVYLRTLAYGRPYIRALLFLAGCTVVSSGIGLVYIFILKNAVNKYSSDDLLSVRNAILLSAGLYVVQSVISFVSSYAGARTSGMITRDIKDSLFGHMLTLPIDHFKERSGGTMMSHLVNDAGRMEGLISNINFRIIGQPVKLTVLFGVAFWMNWKLALILLLFLPLSFIVIKIIGKVISLNSRELLELYEWVLSFIEQKLYGIELIKCMTKEKRESSEYASLNERCLSTEMRRTKSLSFVMPVQQFLMGACIFTILLMGTREVTAGRFSAGSFAAFGMISFAIYGIVGKMGRTYNRMQIALESCERVFGIMDIPGEVLGGKPFPDGFRGISFDRVSFGYSPEAPVLDDMSFEARAGETLLISGESGCGKTTLMRLLTRFYRPSKGGIFVDGEPLSSFDIHSLRTGITFVPQETILFNDTLCNNIVYGCPDAGEEAVRKALETAHALNFTSGLDNGIHERVGDRGVKLSGGEKQRIAIARALLRGGKVLILDEATSSIDEETEESIIRDIKASGIFSTIIIISHRSTLKQFADRCMVLNSAPRLLPG